MAGSNLIDYVNDFVRAAFTKVEARLSAADALAYAGFGYSGVLAQVGDSIAAGYQASYAYVTRLGYGAGIAIANQYAQTGHTVAQIPQDVPNGLASLYQSGKTCVAIFERGTNDIRVNGTTGAALYSMVSNYITQYKNQGFYVAVTTLLPFTDSMDNATTRQGLADYNALVRANSGGADAIIDFAADPVMGAYPTSPNDTTLYVDKLHPTNLGQDNLMKIVRPVVGALLLRAPRAPSSGSGANPAYRGSALAMTSDTYSADDNTAFGQQLTGGYGRTAGNFGSAGQNVAGVPSGFPFAIAVRFKGPSAANNAVQVFASQGDRFVLGMGKDGKLTCQLNQKSGSNSGTGFIGGGDFNGANTLPSIADNANHTVVLNVTATSATLYLDEVQVGTYANGVMNDIDNTTPFGVRHHGASSPPAFVFAGNVSEVAVFNAAQAATVLRNPLSYSAAGLVELWHLDGNGTAATA